MNYMKHFIILFFDANANRFLLDTATRLYADYRPGSPLPEIEHHLTLQYFQCEEKFYSGIINAVTELIPNFLPIDVELTKVHEYVNEMNNFCCLSLLAEKSPRLLQLHSAITRPIDSFHLLHEPSEDWPPHITCFPGLTLAERPANWQFVPNKYFIEPPPKLRGVELRFTRWTGTHIETIHRFGRLDKA